MAHQIPEYLKYVSSITINSGGSGYSSNTGSPPTVAITGGGGTGATATLSVVDGVINAVNITNIGSGYTSAPTLTVTDAPGSSGSGADLSAVLAFAQVSETEYEETSKVGIKYTVPEFIREDYPKFISFIEKYYEYMDSEGKPNNLLLNKEYNNIDDFDDAELNKRSLELAKDFPQILEADRKTLTKNIKDIYESKGSLRSIKAYFKLIYNEEVDVEYPSRNILRASDGVWLQDKTISVIAGYNDFEVLDLIGTTADLVYYETSGSVTRPVRLPISIATVTKIVPTNPQLYTIKVKFENDITSLPGPGQGAAATATISGGVVTAISVTDEGSQYEAAPSVSITSGSGTGFEGRAVISDGKVTEIVIKSNGSGYTDGTVSVTFDTDPVRTVIVGRGDTLEAENIKAFLSRTVTSVSVGAYSGTDAGFSLGEIFAIDETNGDNNNAIIRIDSLTSKNAPELINIITPGRDFTLAEFTKGVGSITGQPVFLTFTTGYLFTENGVFKDDRGKLSNTIRLQDNFRYQSYSYIIKSSIEETVWKKRYKDIMHPAGMQVLGDLVIKSNLGFADFFAIDSEGLHLHEFKTEDIVTSPDVITIVVQWVRAFPNLDDNGFDPVDPDSETINAIDTESFNFGKNPLDVATTIDDYADDLYVESDYLPLGYHGPGVFKTINKVLESQATTTESFDPVISFLRSFTSPATASENFSAGYEMVVTETVILSDVFEYLKYILIEHTENDTVSILDDYTDYYVENGYLPLGYHGPGVYKNIQKTLLNNLSASSILVINTDKVFAETQNINDEAVLTVSSPKTETIAVSDSGSATILSNDDYSPSYFAEDYIGQEYTF